MVFTTNVGHKSFIVPRNLALIILRHMNKTRLVPKLATYDLGMKMESSETVLNTPS